MNSQSIQPEPRGPWPVHQSTLDALDPIQKLLAEAKVKAGLWKVVEG